MTELGMLIDQNYRNSYSAISKQDHQARKFSSSFFFSFFFFLISNSCDFINDQIYFMFTMMNTVKKVQKSQRENLRET